MAFISIKEGYTGVQSGGSISKSGVKRTATRVFTVVTSSPAHGPLWSFPVSAGGVTIPRERSKHPDNDWLRSGVPVVTRKGACYYEVRVPYETPDDASEQHEDPLAVPAEVAWTSQEQTVPYDVDLDNAAVVNSFGKPFDPPLTRTIRDSVLTIRRNQASFDPADKLTFEDSVCLEAIWGAGAGRARMLQFDGSVVNAEQPYWSATYVIAFRMVTPPNTPAGKYWHRCILDQGYDYKDHLGIKHKSQTLVLLDTHGVQTTTAFWLYFREHFDRSWAVLGLDAGQLNWARI